MSKYDAIILNIDGSKKFYEIGAFAAFLENNIHFKGICAGGIGVVNAVFLSLSDIDNLIKFWTMAVGMDLFKVNRLIANLYERNWSKLDTRNFIKEFTSFLAKDKSLYNLKKALKKYIKEDEVRKSNTKLYFDIIDLKSMDFRSISIDDIPNGQLHSYILLAICFPEISSISSGTGFTRGYNRNLVQILLDNGYENIISTEEMVDKQSLKKITIIRSSDFLELEETYSTDIMKEHIKTGYLNTLKILEKVSGKFYYIDIENDEEYAYFEKHMGDSFNDNKDYLIMELLDIDTNNKNLIRKTLCDIIKFSEYRRQSNALISMIENLANIFGIKEKEKYSFSQLKKQIEDIYRKDINNHIRKVEDRSVLSKMINDKTPVLSVDKDTFMDYFLVLVSANPQNYNRLYTNIFDKIPDKLKLGIIALIYLLY